MNGAGTMFRHSLAVSGVFLGVACWFGAEKPVVANNLPAASVEASGTDLSLPTLESAWRLAERRGREGRRRKSGDGEDDNSTASSPCAACEELEGFVPPSVISDDVFTMAGKIRRGDKAAAVEIQRARGAIETGLQPDFIGGADCPEIDSEKWAIDYSHKRPWPALHKGIDIPQPRGTPIRAVAAGTVVGKFMNEGNRKGIEVMLRHTPEQTGLPFHTYSQYTHLREMSPLPIGARVEMGRELGRTSNTGQMGRRTRRDALHFAILYSRHAEWSNDGRLVVPMDGYWMDPNAFYRLEGPHDSRAMAALPRGEKRVAVPYMQADGSFVPADTQRIWPYPCDL